MTRGQRPELVLVHGWGLGSWVWQPVIEPLARGARLTRLDLPGYGPHRGVAPGNLPALARSLLAAAPARAWWLGWSLGGMASLAAALAASRRVAGLVLVGTTPKFLTGPDWPCGVGQQFLQDQARATRLHPRRALTRFATFQTRGDTDSRRLLRWLRHQLRTHTLPDPRALGTGLRLLRETDLRRELPGVSCPTLVLGGDRDPLVPPEAGRRLAAALPQAEHHEMPGCAHVPFLSRPPLFARRVLQFIGQR